LIKRWPFSGSNPFDIQETLKEMEEIFTKEVEELSKRAPKALQRELTLPDGTKMKSCGPFVYGYSVTVGPDGKPNVREFGNFKAETQLGKPHTDVREEREPLTDVIDADGKVRVIVELPGVEKKSITLSGTDDKLTISVENPERKYFKEIELPTKVDVKKATSSYKNGVLAVNIPKRKQEKTESRTIKIE
jgi:HSP20 family protein